MDIIEIEKYLLQKTSQPIAQPGKFPIPVKEYLLNFLHSVNCDNTEITSEKDFIRLAFFMKKYKMTDIDRCGFGGCLHYRIFNKGWDGWNLRNGCCGSHSAKNTLLEKYGVENAMHHTDCVNKLNATIKSLYGVENISKLDFVKEKKKTTTFKNYGVEHNSQSAKIKEKKIKTNQANHGVDNPQQRKEIALKSAATRLEKTGFAYPMQNPEFREKSKSTNLKKYGFENVMHNAEIASRAEKNGSLHRDYIWKTGQISRVQGYEPLVLKDLEDQGYVFDEIKTSKQDVPPILYLFDGKQCVYYPDIFIPAENRIIEVKSAWTLNMHLEKNAAKFDATIAKGYIFDVIVKDIENMNESTTIHHYNTVKLKGLVK